jgi:hypothetical protein
MEVLETARVVAYCCNEIVIPASKRNNYLVVVWEGTCMERDVSGRRCSLEEKVFMGEECSSKRGKLSVWHAGDWTGPRILQPEKRMSGDSSTSATHDIVAMSSEGVKVIMVDFSSLHRILSSGSVLYQKYQISLSETHSCIIPDTIQAKMHGVFENAVKNLNIIELLDSNTGLRKLTAVQKRHLECLVEGPSVYEPAQRLWRSGQPVDKAFIIVAGTVSFVPKRRNGGSAKMKTLTHRLKNEIRDDGEDANDAQISEQMRDSAVRAVRELHAQKRLSLREDDEKSFPDSGDDGSVNESHRGDTNPLLKTEEFERLSAGLQKWADQNHTGADKRKGSESSEASPELSLHDLIDVATVQGDVEKRTDSFIQQEASNKLISKRHSTGELNENLMPRRPSKERFANKVLGRLYNRRMQAHGLVFSRGHFLGDIEKMVEGLLSSVNDGELDRGSSTLFDFDDVDTVTSRETLTIFENEGGKHTAHTSTLAAGKDGCLVMVLPKSSLIPFLDQYPGLLLSLLGTQVVV